MAGQTALTRIPFGASSFDKALLSFASAALAAAAYGIDVGSGARRWIDVTCTIAPDPGSTMPGMISRSNRTAANRLVSSANRHSSSVSDAAPPSYCPEPPTLWTAMSIPPSRWSASANKAATPSAVATSATITSSADASSGIDLAATMTCAPAGAGRRCPCRCRAFRR